MTARASEKTTRSPQAGSQEALPLLDVRDIDVFYGPIQALRGLSLEVRDGEMVALLGANGAGKTTTLRAISGLMAPERGSIRFAGDDITGLPAHEVVQRGIAHLPEGRELFPSMSVEVNLRAGYWTRRKDPSGYEVARDRVMDQFPILRERADQAAGTLSGGEQQMLGVARALMCDPKLLIVDELSLGLAPMIVSQLFEILREINSQGTAVLIVEQFVHMALANTHRAYVLAKGETVLDGASADLLADPQLIASYLGEAEVGDAGGSAGGEAGAAASNGKAAKKSTRTAAKRKARAGAAKPTTSSGRAKKKR